MARKELWKQGKHYLIQADSCLADAGAETLPLNFYLFQLPATSYQLPGEEFKLPTEAVWPGAEI